MHWGTPLVSALPFDESQIARAAEDMIGARGTIVNSGDILVGLFVLLFLAVAWLTLRWMGYNLEAAMKWTSGRLCGQIRYRASVDPEWGAYCHCSICRPFGV